ncbi:MAG: methyltransferase domain-containing protein, partial [Planctomycetota bacterium]
MSPEADTYDLVPYPTSPIRCTHPEILAVAGTLAGLGPAPIDRCRVLEIGCGEGGNLLPMAVGLPDSEFVGIDPSGPAVGRAARLAEELGLRNVVLAKKGVEDLDADLGLFDYIITHGVFSWVAPPLQDRILDVSRRLLRPDGLAYVSYNTYPGWHVRGMVREMMMYHVRNEPSPSGRVAQARELLARLSDVIGPAEKIGPSATELDAFGALLRHEREFLDQLPDAYVFHEHLERVNVPVYFHEFVAHAGRHGLQYVSEALVSSGRLESYPAVVGEVVRSFAKDPIEVQQVLDFVWNRAFRQSVLCHAGRAPAAASDPKRLRPLHVSSPAKRTADAGERATFAVAGARAVTTADPAVKAALSVLEERWPSPVPLEALEATVRERTGADAPNLPEEMLHL